MCVTRVRERARSLKSESRRGDSHESTQAFAWAIRSATRFIAGRKIGTIALCVAVRGSERRFGDGVAMSVCFCRRRRRRCRRPDYETNSRTVVFRICTIYAANCATLISSKKWSAFKLAIGPRASYASMIDLPYRAIKGTAMKIIA